MNPGTTGALFVTFDGAKGVGKTTLIALTAALLRRDGYEVTELSEKELDPHRSATTELLEGFARCPTLGAEADVCMQLARGRAWISTNILARIASRSIVLMDRWYPSDAAFRRVVPFSEVLAINKKAGVIAPDILVAVCCPPELSWARANSRVRGLSSVVVATYEEHVWSSQRFDTAAAEHRWTVCNTQREARDCAAELAVAITTLRQRKPCDDASLS